MPYEKNRRWEKGTKSFWNPLVKHLIGPLSSFPPGTTATKLLKTKLADRRGSFARGDGDPHAAGVPEHDAGGQGDGPRHEGHEPGENQPDDGRIREAV
eukprot:scaffold436_cov267-Pinguiococcus_pyrenoidosus.AAC.28